MPAERLTLMAVHAHPDDEATSTGGALARYADEGIRTVLVTCTDGACGDGPGGAKPDEDGHRPEDVVALREAELRRSCEILAVSHLELLGYRDSGMAGWPQNDSPGSFWTTPVAEVAARLAVLIDHYRPQVVVTYDPNGFYGHPDHIQAHRVTVAAFAATAARPGGPGKLYYPTIPRSALPRFGAALVAAGLEFPDDPGGSGPGSENFGTADEDITAWVDVSSVIDRKFDALAAHASQADSIFFLRLPQSIFADMMGVETYIRAVDHTGGDPRENDLFAGLR